MMTTYEKIAPIIFETYGESEWAAYFTDHLSKKIDNWPIRVPPSYFAETREDMVRLTCWDWFSGGSTAEYVAEKIEAVLNEES
jgi:hypothetical protein